MALTCYNKNKVMLNKRYLFLGALAGLIYNIWPLGYLLNPGVLNRQAYVSVLEASNQPYYKLFIFFDIFCGLIMMLVAYFMWRNKKVKNIVIAGYFLFGLTTLLAAIMPVSCTGSVAQCGISPSQILDPHDLLNLIGSLAFYVSLLVVSKDSIKRKVGNAYLFRSVLWVWCLCGILLVITSVISSVSLIGQSAFLIMSGVAIAIAPLSEGYVYSKRVDP
jgi:hypothetical protein